jgi:hypothetical protein
MHALTKKLAQRSGVSAKDRNGTQYRRVILSGLLRQLVLVGRDHFAAWMPRLCCYPGKPTTQGQSPRWVAHPAT